MKKKEEKTESALQEANPIEKAEKDFFKIVEEEKNKRKKKMVSFILFLNIIPFDWIIKRKFFFFKYRKKIQHPNNKRMHELI